MFNNIAILIDADNFSYMLVDELVLRVGELGNIRKICAYGDFGRDNLRSYKSVILKHNITPVQVFNQIAGKNSTDIALVIDAMDMLNSGIYDAFVIVSNDSDFIRLSSRIRDAGVKSIGAATSKRNERAFDEFLIIEQRARHDVLEAKSENIDENLKDESFLFKFKNIFTNLFNFKTKHSEPQSSNIDELLNLVTEQSKPDDDGFYHCSMLNLIAKDKFNGIDFTKFGYSNKSKELFEQLQKEGKVEVKIESNVMKFRPKETK